MNKLINLFAAKRIIDCRSVGTRITADGKEVPKRKEYENRITLIGPDNSVSITDMKNAKNLSMRRDLKLVKIHDVDSKTRRPVYRLMTSAEYHEEELQRRKEKQASRKNSFLKGEKLVTLSSHIGEHDLMASVKKMLKLVQKQYEVRVVINGDTENSVQENERVYSVIEKNIKDIGNIVQKRSLGKKINFQLLPLKEKSTNSASSGDQHLDSQGPSDKGPL